MNETFFLMAVDLSSYQFLYSPLWGITQEINVLKHHSSIKLSIGCLKYKFDEVKSYIEKLRNLSISFEFVYEISTNTSKENFNDLIDLIFDSAKPCWVPQLKLKQISINFIMTMNDEHFDYFWLKLANLSQIDILKTQLRDYFQIIKLIDVLEQSKLKVCELEIEYNKCKLFDECKERILQYQINSGNSVRFQNHSKGTLFEQEHQFSIYPRF